MDDDGMNILIESFILKVKDLLIDSSDIRLEMWSRWEPNPFKNNVKNTQTAQSPQTTLSTQSSQATLIDTPEKPEIYKSSELNHELLTLAYKCQLMIQDTIYAENIANNNDVEYGQKYMSPSIEYLQYEPSRFITEALNGHETSQECPIVALDFETSGLDMETSYIISVGIAIYCPPLGNKCITYHTLVNPEVKDFKMPQAAYNIHKIRETALKNKPTIWNIAGFIHWALHNRFVVGHNSWDFDMPFLQKEMRRMGVEHYIPKPAIHVDTLRLMRKEFRHSKASLSDAYITTQKYALKNETPCKWESSKAHNAVYDALRCLEIFAMSCHKPSISWRRDNNKLACWATGSLKNFQEHCLHQTDKQQTQLELTSRYLSLFPTL